MEDDEPRCTKRRCTSPMPADFTDPDHVASEDEEDDVPDTSRSGLRDEDSEWNDPLQAIFDRQMEEIESADEEDNDFDAEK